MSDLRWLTHGDFAPHLGDRFEVGTDEGTLPVELVEAIESSRPGGDGPNGETRLQFSLLFQGPTTPQLDQSMHRVSHPELGDLDLFLVPIGPHGDGMGYEAAFA